ncbi:MAG: PKD domain-containing protein, partial [Methanoregula sp.]
MKCYSAHVSGSPSAGMNRPSNTIARRACLPGTGLFLLIAMLIAFAVLMVPVGAADTTSDTAITTAHNATVTTGTVVPTVSITTIPTTSLASLFADDRESIKVVDQGVSRTYTPYEEDMATVSSGSDAVLQNHYLSSIKTGNLAGTAWPKFQNNLNNTGTSPYNGPHIGNDVWTYTTGDLIRGQPAIGSDGTIYLGSYDKKLYAFNPDGSVKWSYTTGNQIVGSAAIGSDGILYIGSYDTKLYAFNPDGTLNWSYTTGNRIFGSPAIGSDGTVYVGSRDKNLYALNPNGTLKWRYTTGHQIFSSAAIGSDGTIYTGSLDNKLYALNSDGTLKWSYTTGNQIYGSAAIGSDGTIYTGSLDNKLYALNPDGTLKWSYITGNQIYGSPAIGSDGTIYIGSYDNKIYALNPEGTLKWSYTTGNPILGSAVIGADGIIYIGSLDNKLYALNPEGTLKWSYTTGNQIYGSAAIGSDGTLYIGGFDSTLYAFRDAVPVVKFTSSSTGGEAPLSVQFTDLSKGNITARLWDFGDSQTSTEKNPAHTYLTTGSYTVNLTVSNDLGSNSSVQTGYITVGTGIPVGNFTANVTSSTAPPLTVQFTDTTTVNPTAWHWDFGDGVTSSERNPDHTYATAGIYTVNLTVLNSYGSNSCVKTDYITVGSGISVGAFTANTTSGNAPLAVQFTDGSTLNPASWYWDFGDNVTSTEQNPVHVYTADGSYTVNLTVSNSYGSNSCVKTGYITVGSGIPVGAFTVNTTSGNAPLTVQFTDGSTINPTAWSWDFGDNSTSTEQNPVHTYAANGNYTVNLTISNSYGSNSCVKTGYITVGSGIPV